MLRQSLDDLIAFVAVADEKSFTKAAARLGISQPALSQTIRELEKRLDLRLLMRTTRSVSVTDAGNQLLKVIGPKLEEIQTALTTLNEQRDQPSGTIRISAGEHPASTIIQPALKKILLDYPLVHFEVVADYKMIDIVADGFDAGVRLGHQIAKDMVAIRIGPDFRMAVVGAPSYFSRFPAPKYPGDLTNHQCINLRLPTLWTIKPWEFEKPGHGTVKVATEGRLVFNNITLRLQSALDGLGLALLPEDQVVEFISTGKLIRVLEDWCPKLSGYHLYYPSRRHHTPAFTILLDTLRTTNR